MKTKFNPVYSFAAASALALAMGMPAETANALMLTPSTIGVKTCNINSNFGDLIEINNCFLTNYDGLNIFYKSNVDENDSTGAGDDEKDYADFYNTVFTNAYDDPADALITWVTGSDTWFNCPTCFLIVKDGNASPSQYLFDLGSWDGKESISLTGFWPDQGAISNVAIWSGSSTSSTTGQTTSGNQVSEPGVLGLLGLGLLGQAFLLRQRRRRLQK